MALKSDNPSLLTSGLCSATVQNQRDIAPIIFYLKWFISINKAISYYFSPFKK